MYLNPILETIGLSSSQLGTGALVANAIATVSRIVFGIISDRTNKRNLVMVALSAASVACVLSFFAFPKPIQYSFMGTALNDSVYAFKALDEYTQVALIMSVKPFNYAIGAYRNEWVCHRLHHLDNPNGNRSIVPVNWPREMTTCALETLPDMVFNLRLFNASMDRQFAIYGTNHSGAVGELVWPAVADLIKQFPTELKCAAITVDDTLTLSHTGAIIPGRAVVGIVVAATILRTLVSTLHAPILNLLDSTAYDLLGEEKSDQYGRSRLFGSLGFVVSSIIAGLCISQLSFGISARVRAPDYTPSLVCASIFLFLGTLFSVHPSQDGQTGRQTYFFKATALALRSKEMIACLLTSFLSGMIFSLFGEYLFLILTRQYGVPHFVLGILVSINVISEVPSFSISGYVLKHVGTTFCLVFAHVCWAMAFFLYGYLTNYWYFLIPQLLFGLGFPFLYNALLTQSANVGRQCKIGDGNAISTMHGLVTAMMFGVTSSLGGFVWGVLLDHYSGRTIFYIASVYCCILVVLIPILFLAITKSSCFPDQGSDRPPSNNEETQTMLTHEEAKMNV